MRVLYKHAVWGSLGMYHLQQWKVNIQLWIAKPKCSHPGGDCFERMYTSQKISLAGSWWFQSLWCSSLVFEVYCPCWISNIVFIPGRNHRDSWRFNIPPWWFTLHTKWVHVPMGRFPTKIASEATSCRRHVGAPDCGRTWHLSGILGPRGLDPEGVVVYRWDLHKLGKTLERYSLQMNGWLHGIIHVNCG